jgi:hypothetical protein
VGTFEADVQVGMIQGRGPARAVIPDLELDLGLFRSVELDLDAAYAIEGPESRPRSHSITARPTACGPRPKVGIFSFDAGPAGPGLAVGLQLGPKLPVAPGSRGVGGEALALVGLHLARLHAVVNTGVFARSGAGRRPGAPARARGRSRPEPRPRRRRPLLRDRRAVRGLVRVVGSASDARDGGWRGRRRRTSSWRSWGSWDWWRAVTAMACCWGVAAVALPSDVPAARAAARARARDGARPSSARLSALIAASDTRARRRR